MSRQTEPRKRADQTASPVRPTRINPTLEAQRAKASPGMSSRDYITRFTQADVMPEMDPDARNAQIIGICRRILPAQTKKATDLQVLRLHFSFMAGRL